MGAPLTDQLNTMRRQARRASCGQGTRQSPWTMGRSYAKIGA